MKNNDETPRKSGGRVMSNAMPRQGIRSHHRRPGKRGIIAACALLLTCASAARAADVLFTRSMETRQIKLSSYVVTCTLDFTGVNATHTYGVTLFAQGNGVTTFPYGGEVGPDALTFIIDEPGLHGLKPPSKAAGSP